MAIEIRSASEIAAMRRAGAVAAATLHAVGQQLRARMTTAAIDALVRDDTRRRGAKPSQLGYHGFPAAVCTSRNEVVCHGIPSPRVVLQPGDIVNVDITSCLDGWHSDTSATFAVGPLTPEAAHLVDTARRARDAGIAVTSVRAPASETSAPPSRRWPARPDAASCARTAATASAARCTATRTSPTWAPAASGRASRRVWCSPSSR